MNDDGRRGHEGGVTLMLADTSQNDCLGVSEPRWYVEVRMIYVRE